MIRRMSRSCFLANLWLIIAAASVGVALGGTPTLAQVRVNQLSLKPAPHCLGEAVLLGDLFDGAGIRASLVIAHATGSSSVIDATRIQSLVASLGLNWDNPTGLKRIIVTQISSPGGNETDAVLTRQTLASETTHPSRNAPDLPVASRGHRDVLVFSHAMTPGQVVGASDLVLARPVEAEGLSGLPDSADQVIGKAMKWPIREGGIVRMIDVTAPVMIKRGEVIRVRWISQSLSLSLMGQAQKDGAQGDTITVMNPQSHKLIEAAVTGPGQAQAIQAVPTPALAIR